MPAQALGASRDDQLKRLAVHPGTNGAMVPDAQLEDPLEGVRSRPGLLASEALPGGSRRVALADLKWIAGGSLTTSPLVGSWRHQSKEPRFLTVPFVPGAHSQGSGPHEEPPALHVGRPHPSPSAPLHLTRTLRDETVAITGILKDVHVSSDVLPEQVRPKGEPTEESESPPRAKSRRKGPRRRGR